MAFSPFEKWTDFKERLPRPVGFFVEVVELILTLLILLTLVRQGVFERRYIPSESMLPNLQVQDQLIIEKVSQNLHKIGLAKDFQRGDIIVFYPPTNANNGIDLQKDFANTFVRLTGISADLKIGKWTVFPFLPLAEVAYIKRIVAVPGDQIEIIRGDGVYINGKKIHYGLYGGEGYVSEPPFYNSIRTKRDLYQTSISSNCSTPLDESFDVDAPIVLPKDHYFVMGDNRNNSKDSHCWGFVKKDRIIGRAFAIVWRDLSLKPELRPTYYLR